MELVKPIKPFFLDTFLSKNFQLFPFADDKKFTIIANKNFATCKMPNLSAAKYSVGNAR